MKLKILIIIAIALNGILAFAKQETESSEILLKNLQFPEGPAMDSKGNIWIVEITRPCITMLDKSGNVKRYPVPDGAPNSIAIDSLDRVWFCDAKKSYVSLLYPDTGEIKHICEKADGKRLCSPNDLTIDSRGNVIFTCVNGASVKLARGYVCALNSNGAKKIITEKYFANGVGVSPDGKKLVIAETHKKRLLIGDWDAEKLVWSNEKVLAEVGGDVGPDGMAFDKNGNVYVAVYGGRAIKVVSPEGEIIKEIKLSGKNPTNCAFTPDGCLLVTEDERDELLKIKLDVKPAPVFRKSWLP